MKGKRPDILFVTKSDLSGTNGHNIVTREIAKAMNQNEKINVHIVCPKPAEDLLNDFDQEFENRMYFFKRPKKIKFKERAYGVIRMAYALNRAIQEVKPDFIVARWSPVFIAPPILSKFYNIPFLLLSRGRQYKTLRYNTIIEQLYKYNVRIAQQVYVASKEIQQDTNNFRRDDQSDSVYLPNAVDPKNFYPVEREVARSKIGFELGDNFVIGFVGSMRPYHRLDLLIKSLKHIEKSDQVTLLIVGEGPQKDDFQKLAKNEGVDDNVIFVGFVQHPEVKYYISASDILYGVSDQQSATPVKIFEYLACGRPVIVRNISELNFVRKKDLGQMVNPTVNSIAEAIDDLRKISSSERLGISQKAREYIVSNHTWKAAIEKILKDIGK